MKKPKRIILIRHAESEGNDDPIVYQEMPDHEIPLTFLGVEQARSLGKKMKEEILRDERARVYVSPYNRARQTCRLLLEFIGNNVTTVYEEPRLREQDWGNRRPFQETERIKRERLEYGRFYFRFPQGESGADVYDRVSTFLETLHRDFEKKDYPSSAVIVTHGLTMLLFLMRWFHWSVEKFERHRMPDNCQMVIMELQADGRYRLATKLKQE